jgi:hypothetical protein
MEDQDQDQDEEIEIADLLADDERDSVVLARWKDRLTSYVDAQGSLDALRLRADTEPPWPASGNPMLAYLRERGAEMAGDEGLAAALAWITRNAWFEGAIAERARIARLIDDD